MKCTNCRCVIPDRSEYCVYCGQEVSKGDTPTYPVYNRPVDYSVPSYPAVYQTPYDDENCFYGLLEENDGSDAYDTYYEADYYGGYIAGQNMDNGVARRSLRYRISDIDISTILICFAGFYCIIILLLILLILLMAL